MAENNQLELVSLLEVREIVHGEEHRHLPDFLGFLSRNHGGTFAEFEDAAVFRAADEFDPRDGIFPDLHGYRNAACVPSVGEPMPQGSKSKLDPLN